MGLNGTYDPIGRQILMKKHLPSLSKVYNLLDQDDSQRTIHIHAHHGMKPSAFQDSSGPPYGYNQKAWPLCSHCDGLGHDVDRCYKSMDIHLVLSQETSFSLLKNNSLATISTNMVINTKASETPSVPHQLPSSGHTLGSPLHAFTPE